MTCRTAADADDASGADPWDDGLADPFADPAAANLFSAEIENVNASDWDVDTDLIWGDDDGRTRSTTAAAPDSTSRSERLALIRAEFHSAGRVHPPCHLSRWNWGARAGNGQHGGVRIGRTRPDIDVERGDRAGREEQEAPARRRPRPPEPRSHPPRSRGAGIRHDGLVHNLGELAAEPAAPTSPSGSSRPRAAARSRRAGHRRRRVQAGQEQAHQRARERAGVPGRRRHRHQRADLGGVRARSPRRGCYPQTRTPRRSRARPWSDSRCRSRSWPTTCRSAATPATSAASSRPRCCCRARSSAAGCKLVDSPGVGGLDSSNALATLSALSSAHAVLLVSDASQEYTEPEVQFLKHAMRISPNVAAVLAKTDLYPEWRQIEQIDRGHLSDVGRRADLLGVERPAAARGRAAGPRAQRRVGLPRARRAPAARGARARRAASTSAAPCTTSSRWSSS